MTKKRNDRKEARREDAEARQAAWAALTPAEKLADLDRRFGEGVGCTRQRARIKREMEKLT